jgi:hypothetical protein
MRGSFEAELISTEAEVQDDLQALEEELRESLYNNYFGGALDSLEAPTAKLKKRPNGFDATFFFAMQFSFEGGSGLAQCPIDVRKTSEVRHDAGCGLALTKAAFAASKRNLRKWLELDDHSVHGLKFTRAEFLAAQIVLFGVEKATRTQTTAEWWSFYNDKGNLCDVPKSFHLGPLRRKK